MSHLADELSDATCCLSDDLNLLLDEDWNRPGRVLSSREESFAIRILEHIKMASGLLGMLRKEKTSA